MLTRFAKMPSGWALGLLAILSLSVACGKKCQAPPSQAFTSLTDTPWRLVSSSNQNLYTPTTGLQYLNNFTFLILQFTQDGNGSLTRVFNNDEENSPFFNLKWNIPPQGGGELLVEYIPATSGSSGTTSGTDGGSNIYYTYRLSSELDMTDSSGNTYRWVPFLGVIAPDDICTF